MAMVRQPVVTIGGPVLPSPSPLITLPTSDVLPLRSVGPPTVTRRESPPFVGFKVLPLGVRVLTSACLRLARQVGILNYEFSTAATMIPMQSVQILLNMVKKLLRVRRQPLSVVLLKNFNGICKLAIIVSGLALQ